MTWTILVLVLGIALYMFGGMLLKQDTKKPVAGVIWAKKAIKVLAIIIMAGSICRLYVPYYLTSVNPAIIQEMVEGMQAQQNAEKNKAIRKLVRESAFEMSEHAPVLGNPKAKKTIYVWTAASCGYCRRVHGELDRVLKARDDVKVVMKNFSIHGVMSDGPARAMIAAKMQDTAKAAKFADIIMNYVEVNKEDIKPESRFMEDLGFTSFDFMSMLGEVEDVFDVEIVEEEAADIRTVKEALDYLEKLTGGN